MSEDDWARRAELGGLLRACRSRLVRPAVPGARRGGMRQEDVAGLAEVSVRIYGAFERGDYAATAQVVDRIAAALQMSEAERSALHVLASRQDPPRRLTRPARNLPGEQDQALRDLVSCSPYAAALTDETWTVLHHNRDMSAWAGGWFESVAPTDRHLVAYLFSGHAEASLPDIRAVRRASHRLAAIPVRQKPLLARLHRYGREASPGAAPRQPSCGRGASWPSPRICTPSRSVTPAPPRSSQRMSSSRP